MIGNGEIKMKENVVVFNFMKNNEKDVQRLLEVFQAKNNFVKVYNQPTYEEFMTARDKIAEEKFDLFDYTAIVVLDNRNPFEHILLSEDNREIFLRADLLTRIQKEGKKHLFIIHTNQNFQGADYKPKKSVNNVRSESFSFIAASPSEEQLLKNNGSSPFIQSFCKHYEEYGDTRNMNFIYGKILEDVADCEVYSEVYIDLKKAIFGKGCTDEALFDWFD